MKTEEKAIVGSIVALLALGAVFARTKFALDVPLKAQENTVSNSGRNALSLTNTIPTFRDLASELKTDIENQVYQEADAVDRIERLNRADDKYDTDFYEFGVGGSVDFTLNPGEGYRVKVNSLIDDPGSANDFEFTVFGDHEDPTIRLYGPGEELSPADDAGCDEAEKTPAGRCESASGSQLISLPYTVLSLKASEIRSEINLAQGSAFSSISRFEIASDTLLTYAGVSTSNDFDITPGVAYVLKVNEGFEWEPDIAGDVFVDIIQHRPGCSNPDGGHISIRNTSLDFDIKISWDGHPDADKDNFIFRPDDSSVTCSTAGTCKVDTCPDPDPPPGDPDEGGCEEIDCDDCGCEIDGGVEVVVEANTVQPETCLNTGCGSSGNDCDNDSQATPDQCKDPPTVFCNALQEPNYTFTIDEVRWDSTWEENPTTMGLLPTITEINCCEFVCTQAPTISCTSDNDCIGNGICDVPDICTEPLP